MQANSISDEQLAIRLKNGESQAISTIYLKFKYGLYSFCYRLVSDSAIAEDVVHETFVKIISERTKLQNPLALKAWIFTIARNEAFAVMKRKKNFRELREHDENIFEDESVISEGQERQIIIEQFLNKLLPQYKEVLILREYEQLNYEEIASVTGTTVSSVKSRLFKARKALFEKLEPLWKASEI